MCWPCQTRYRSTTSATANVLAMVERCPVWIKKVESCINVSVFSNPDGPIAPSSRIYLDLPAPRSFTALGLPYTIIIKLPICRYSRSWVRCTWTQMSTRPATTGNAVVAPYWYMNCVQDSWKCYMQSTLRNTKVTLK